MEDIEYHFCSMCTFKAFTPEQLVKHTVREHKSDPNFRVHCSVCGASFDKWPSFQKHVQRKHRALAPDVDVHDHIDKNNKPGVTENILNPDPAHPGTSNFASFEEEMQWNAAKYILVLKEKHLLTQRALNATLESTKDLVNHVVDAVKRKLLNKLERNEVNINEILAEEDDCLGEGENGIFDTCFLFDQLDSEYLQARFFKERFHLTVCM